MRTLTKHCAKLEQFSSALMSETVDVVTLDVYASPSEELAARKPKTDYQCLGCSRTTKLRHGNNSAQPFPKC
jgi:hypothetical protein